MSDTKEVSHVEVIARGLLIGPRGVLLCRSVGADYAYLPGGHIEFGESAAIALARELDEEMGVKMKVEGFLGAIESSFVQKGELHHEITLVFEMTSAQVARRAKLPSKEAHIEFFWHPVRDLRSVNALPRALCEMAPKWSLGRREPWASQMEHG
jgi:8-oxo-dGTP pyrophosphatase MutT (NUDIX family)